MRTPKGQRQFIKTLWVLAAEKQNMREVARNFELQKLIHIQKVLNLGKSY